MRCSAHVQQHVHMLEKAILASLYAVIGCDAVEVSRLADQLDVWIDDEGLYNAQANPLATKLAHHFSTISHPDTSSPCPAGWPCPGRAGPGFRAGSGRPSWS